MRNNGIPRMIWSVIIKRRGERGNLGKSGWMSRKTGN